ncbi:MAG: S8 family serine peptidase [Anaerolineales bacterium]|nr:S8 family serine peptidase [Anaerolineales bacterium]
MKRSSLSINLLILVLFLSAIILYPFDDNRQVIAAPRTDSPVVEVEPSLLAQIQENESAGYLVYFKDVPDLSPAYSMEWEARGQFVVSALQANAARSQERTRAYLDAQGIQYQSFWIDNLIAVEGSNQAVFSKLMEFAEIKALRTRRAMRVIEPDRSLANTVNAPLAIEPNISHVGADQVWAMGYTGAGLVVSNIDTGVRYTHQALNSHYRGKLGGGGYDHDYNWWDPYGDHPLSPADDHGHGSHTMGTMVGNDGGSNVIGMAPGATWMACRGCDTNNCTDSALLECAQFIAAPWDLNQANPNPGLRPAVVNNSWGDCSQYYDNWYQGVVNSWHAAGIYPVFSNGNASNCGYSSPPGLNTVGNPARYGNVTGVGSTGQSNGQYASHSNWGPTDNPDTVNPVSGWEDLKPQVLAPGVNIRSSLNGSDTQYASWGGTSMSSPHVSGLIALMWDAAPCLVGDYAATETIIQETANPIPYDDGTGGGAHSPNYASGWGEIDAPVAVQAARASCGEFLLNAAPASQAVCSLAVNEADYDLSLTPMGTIIQPVNLSVTGNPAGTTTAFSDNPVTPPGSSTLTIGNLSAAAFGGYSLVISGASPLHTDSATVDLDVYTASPGALSLLSPAAGAMDQPPRPTFTWTAADQASTYTIEIAANSSFTDVLHTAALNNTSYTPKVDLATNTHLYWRVHAANPCGTGAYSPTWDFTTRPAPGECALGTSPVLYFSDDFESGAPGWTHGGVNDSWALSGARVHSGSFAYYGAGKTIPSDQRLLSPAGGVALPLGLDDLTLQFWNYQEMEDRVAGCYDGGILEISADGGNTWTQAPSSNLLTDPYDGPISNFFSNPLGGLNAWCGDPQAWLRSVADLSAYAGGTVSFRFRLGTDNSTAHEGWYIDDVYVQACIPDVYNFSFGPDSAIDTTPSSSVTHTFSLQNLGLADSYTLTLTSGDWTTTLQTASPLALGAGANAAVAVLVNAPPLDGTDTFTITVQSVTSPTLVILATGQTTVQEEEPAAWRINLPLILR